jgi:hypothetical protein
MIHKWLVDQPIFAKDGSKLDGPAFAISVGEKGGGESAGGLNPGPNSLLRSKPIGQQRFFEAAAVVPP